MDGFEVLGVLARVLGGAPTQKVMAQRAFEVLLGALGSLEALCWRSWDGVGGFVASEGGVEALGVWRAAEADRVRGVWHRRGPVGWEMGVGAGVRLRVVGEPPQVPWWLGLEGVFEGARGHAALLGQLAQVSRRAHQENRRWRRQAKQQDRSAVWRSAAMAQVTEQLSQVAGYDTTVLLLGESGTGKEVLARQLHGWSGRSRGPFVRLNCGALPESLLESALFGHEPGAFTGARGRHRGVFEQAGGGTLLLDEVGELSAGAQVKLLRVLAERVVTRLGSEREVKVDVRVVAATHRPLVQMVSQGKFRQDLYYRLCVFPVVVPPLRQRAQDLPALIEVLLEKLCRRLGRAVPAITQSALAQAASHHWPGNVRELENALERALILTPSGPIAQIVSRETAFAALPQRAAVIGGGQRRAPVEGWEEGSRRIIEAALVACEGRVYGANGAARALGLRPTTLQGKMKRLGIERAVFVASPDDGLD